MNTGGVIDINNQGILSDTWGKGTLLKTSSSYESELEFQITTMAGWGSLFMVSSGLVIGMAG